MGTICCSAGKLRLKKLKHPEPTLRKLEFELHMLHLRAENLRVVGKA